MRKAFTMLELVFVLVIIGIIAAVALPETRTNPLREAATQVISHIRYTQHLAMIDDKHDAGTPNWFIARWQILFHLDNSGEGHRIYSIYSDIDLGDTGTPDSNEIAINPLSQQLMTGNPSYSNRTKDMDLTDRYNINNVNITDCGNSQRIFFDHLGRPHTNNNNLFNYISLNQCKIELVNSEGSIIIAVDAETGYAHILH